MGPRPNDRRKVGPAHSMDTGGSPDRTINKPAGYRFHKDNRVTLTLLSPVGTADGPDREAIHGRLADGTKVTIERAFRAATAHGTETWEASGYFLGALSTRPEMRSFAG